MKMSHGTVGMPKVESGCRSRSIRVIIDISNLVSYHHSQGVPGATLDLEMGIAQHIYQDVCKPAKIMSLQSQPCDSPVWEDLTRPRSGVFTGYHDIPSFVQLVRSQRLGKLIKGGWNCSIYTWQEKLLCVVNQLSFLVVDESSKGWADRPDNSRILVCLHRREAS